MKSAAFSPGLFFVILLNAFTVFFSPAQGYAGERAENKLSSSPAGFVFDLSPQFQPNYEKPRQYSRSEMKAMVREVVMKIQAKSGQYFSRMDPQHVWYLADFFGLMSREDLDPYSKPMQDADIRYFSEVSEHEDKELYPETAEDLIIRFYWEGLVREAAAHCKMRIVNEKRAVHPEKSRAKVSEIATTAMFDKTPGMTTAYARQLGAERYDFSMLVTYLKLKGLSAR
jgi:hypothetical protein